MTETKLSEQSVASDVCVTGYITIRRDRNSAGGGVGIWAKSGLSIPELSYLNNPELEILWVSLSLQRGETIVIGGVYCPGSCPWRDTRLIEYLDDNLADIRSLGRYIIIAGDFNVHNREWLCSTKTTIAGEAMEECASHHLTQLVTNPTRGDNTLDLILSDFPANRPATIYPTPPPLGRSDYAVVITEFCVQPWQEVPTTRCVWDYKAADWNRMRACLRQTNWTDIITANPKHSCQNLTTTILGCMQELIPNRSITTRPCDPKWWTPECTNAVKAKDSAWERWHWNMDDHGLKQHFVLAVSQAANAIATSKSAMQARIRTKLASGSLHNKEWWSSLKSATGSSRESSIPLLIDSSGRECHSSQEKSESFAEHFSRKCGLGNEDLRAGISQHWRALTTLLYSTSVSECKL